MHEQSACILMASLSFLTGIIFFIAAIIQVTRISARKSMCSGRALARVVDLEAFTGYDDDGRKKTYCKPVYLFSVGDSWYRVTDSIGRTCRPTMLYHNVLLCYNPSDPTDAFALRERGSLLLVCASVLFGVLCVVFAIILVIVSTVYL